MRAVMAVFIFLCLASVPAEAAITMTLDQSTIDFRSMDPGQTREIADRGDSQNSLTCTSTNNRGWYLKAHLVRPFTSGMNTIPAENFSWMVVSIGAGMGLVTNNINIYTPFTTTPSVVYSSADTDNTGVEVQLKFRYQLAVPQNQIAGGYDALVRWTMIETL